MGKKSTFTPVRVAGRSPDQLTGSLIPQLAWLTDDMLKPSTRTGGMAARVK